MLVTRHAHVERGNGGLGALVYLLLLPALRNFVVHHLEENGDSGERTGVCSCAWPSNLYAGGYVALVKDCLRGDHYLPYHACVASISRFTRSL